MRYAEVGTDYLIELETVDGNDDITVKVELQKQWFTGNIEALEKLSRRIAHDLRDEILVSPNIRLVEPGSLPKTEGKAIRVIDSRIP